MKTRSNKSTGRSLIDNQVKLELKILKYFPRNIEKAGKKSGFKIIKINPTNRETL